MGILGFNPHWGTPPDPAAPGRMPGGSSSGSASAVAAGACDVALGTGSGGSVRVPASFCGLYGLRPTHGRIPFDGVCRQAPSFDTAGWFARDAATFARVAAVGALLGRAPEPAAIAVPGELEVWAGQRNVLQRAEAWRTFEAWIEEHNPRLDFNVARNPALASAATQDEIANADVARHRARDRAEALLGCDGGCGSILCLPTTPFPAPPAPFPLGEIDRLSARIGLLTSCRPHRRPAAQPAAGAARRPSGGPIPPRRTRRRCATGRHRPGAGAPVSVRCEGSFMERRR
jgi:amidase